MMVLGLTGGVGAGKSRILELFSHDYGAQVIQADLVARKLEDPGQPGLTGLVSLFGTGILQVHWTARASRTGFLEIRKR